MSVCPYYNKPSQEGLYQHFKAIAAATELPVVLYNVPGRTGVNMKAETTVRLARDCRNIVAIKEASGNLEQVDEIIGTIEGTEEQVIVTAMTPEDILAAIGMAGEGVPVNPSGQILTEMSAEDVQNILKR